MDRGERPTVAQAWAFIREHVDFERLDVFQKKRYRLFECCAGLPRYRGWSMRDYVNAIDPVSYTHLDVYKRQAYAAAQAL